MTRGDAIATCLALAAAVGGCAPAATPVPDVGYHLSSPQDVRALGRVVFVELAHEDAHSEMARETTNALYKALQARRLFHVSVVRRDDPVCRDLPLGVDSPLTLEDLSLLRRRLRCDAVLMGRIKAYAPHPRMQIGLYLNLLDLRDGKVVWGVNHVWDTTEQSVQKELRDFYRRTMDRRYAPVAWRLATMSPKHFAKFVAEQTAMTLPAMSDEREEESAIGR
ncbi:MAG: hypothetical protein ACOC8F_00785 [Planctomycetota bacterium]